MNEQGLLRREAGPGAMIDTWIAAVDGVGPDGWRTIADLAELPDHVRADSHYWCDQVFAPDANPHDVPGVTRAFHCGAGCAPDLLRHAYTAKGLDLSVVEGRNFLLVRVSRRSLDMMALAEEERAAAVARVAATIFQTPLTFCHCTPLGDGALFCTNTGPDPRVIASWAERAEGGVRDGELWFVCYKRVSQIVGFFDPTRWFSDAMCGVKRCAGAKRSRRRGGQRSR